MSYHCYQINNLIYLYASHKKGYFEYSLSRFESLDRIFQKQDDWLKYSRLFILYVLETLNFQFFSGKEATYNKVKLWVFTGEYYNIRAADKLRVELETNYFNKDELPKNLQTEFGKLKGMSNYLVYVHITDFKHGITP